MPMGLIQRIKDHHEDLLRVLQQVEVLAGASAPEDILRAKVDTLRHRLLAYELMTERLVAAPLRRSHLLDDRQLDALEMELSRLEMEADRLSRDHPDAEAVVDLVRAIREHVDRRAHALEPSARCALAEGRLSGVPGWYVEDVYELHGGPVAHTPEEWLG